MSGLCNNTRTGFNRSDVLAAILITCLSGPLSLSREFETVTIGKQEWMRQNVDVERFRNGDPILQVETPRQWKKAADEGRPAWCHYDYDPNLGKTYGKLYNGYALTDARGLAPCSWHVPGEAEWRALVAHLGGAALAGGKMKASEATHWNNSNAEPTNESGFSALPAGFVDPHGGFHRLGRGASFWCASDTACYWSIHNAGPEICRYYGTTPYYGFSVRCVKDTPSASTPPAAAYLGQEPPGKQPEVFAPGIVSQEGRPEISPAWSPDGRTFAYVFYSKDPNGSKPKGHQRLIQQDPDLAWNEVDANTVLGRDDVYGLRFSPDNETLSFVHTDPQEDIWLCRRTSDAWSAPVPLPAPINTAGREANHMFTRDGTLYFIANNRHKEQTGFRTCGDIFRAVPANGSYQTVEELPFCTAFDEEHLYVAPDESYIIFSSQRRNAYGWNELLYGNYDLFISFRQGPGIWTHPQILGPAVNTKGAEIDPFVTADGRYLFFGRSDGGETDLYWVDAGFIDELRDEINRRQELFVGPK